MINGSADIPLRVTFQDGPLRNDHAKHRMDVLDAAFLAAAHGITVVDLRSAFTAFVGFKAFRITEFTTSVGKDHRKKEKEFRGISQGFLDPVEFQRNSPFRTAVHEPADQEFILRKIDRKDAFVGTLS